VTTTDYAIIKRQYPIRDYLARRGIRLDKDDMFSCVAPDHPDKTPSAHVFTKDGYDAWKCFGCGRHGDVIDLVCLDQGLEKPEAVVYLTGKEPIKPPPPIREQPRLRVVNDLGPIPESAPVIRAGHPTPPITRKDGTTRKGQMPEAVHEYRDPGGKLLAYVLRFPPKGTFKKSTPPVRWDVSLSGFVWAGFAGEERAPLYNAPELAARPHAPVLMVEGEACVDVAQVLLPDWVVTTWIGGVGQFKKADLTQLDGREVTFWPDKDPGGFEAMKHMAEKVTTSRRYWIEPKAEWEPGFDIKDLAGQGPGLIEPVIASRAFMVRPAQELGERDPIRAYWQTKTRGGWVPDELGESIVMNPGGPVAAKSEFNAYLAFCHHPRFQSLEWDTLQRVVRFENKRLEPHQYRDFAGMLYAATKLSTGRDATNSAVADAALTRQVNGLARQLRAVQWDKKERPLWRYFGTQYSLWHDMALRRWMFGLARRILEPGCQHDIMLILEGPQGVGKTSALRALASPFDYDGYVDMISLGSKDNDWMKIGGKLIVDLSELAAHRAAGDDVIKGKLSNTHDNYRPPYASHFIDAPRSCVFAGSTNRQDAYLSDITGNRRFAPIEVSGKVDIFGLIRDREQIFAEAIVGLDNGETNWWSDSELEQQRFQVEGRREATYYEELIRELLDSLHKSIRFLTPREVWQKLEAHDTTIRRRIKPEVDRILSAHGWSARPDTKGMRRSGWWKTGKD
jgi:predicted P-loop ATPase